jgi:crotonobetainyl-CoA:carnitine CoA-transferase CaiB-like acyl-CoA transferase
MAAVMMSMNERVHYDLSGIDLGAEQPILGATDCPFFTSPEGHEFVVPVSLVGSLTFPFYLNAMRRPDLADDPRFLTPRLRKTTWAKAWVTTREVSDRHGGVITIPAPPWHFSGHDGTLTPQLPARQGEDNADILKELGYTDDQVQALITSAALIEPARELTAEADS